MAMHLTFEDALLISITAFIIKIKYINIDKTDIYKGLTDLCHIVEKEYVAYYKDKPILLDDAIAIEYFSKNFNTLGNNFTNRWIGEIKKIY